MIELGTLSPEVLATHMKEFAPLAVKAMAMAYEDEDGEEHPLELTDMELYNSWLQCIEGNVTPIFMGWMLGKGYSCNEITMGTLQDAVTIAMSGTKKTFIDGGWDDGTLKKH